MTLVSNITVYLVTWAFLGIGEDQDKIGPKVNYNITTLPFVCQQRPPVHKPNWK